ncbi:hypothetical protein [Geminisphaera colitermitum]|uniref:hypothetical protein n=1 Tax=Geminisphaera colitermitum TaxID=1148786 RepID=UPI000158CBA3|nr:hypothetical protein [Geminisphaera colitermitum]
MNTKKLSTPIRKCLFIRENGFYMLEIPEGTIADNAEANPGTLRVEDAITGEVLWSNVRDEPCEMASNENQKCFTNTCVATIALALASCSVVCFSFLITSDFRLPICFFFRLTVFCGASQFFQADGFSF